MHLPAAARQLLSEDKNKSYQEQPCQSISEARIAYIISANPFVRECQDARHPLQNGYKTPGASVLPIHIRMIAALQLRLLALLICMPNDYTKAEIPGYRQFGKRMPDGLPIEVLQVQNNSLGSYGMFLHAFASTRGRFDYYVMAEEDYVPANPYVTEELVRIYKLAFQGGEYGMLAGVLQGRPVERYSRFPLHAEGSHIMSASSLDYLFDHTYNKVGWKGSMAERMLFLRNKSSSVSCGYYNFIQVGFGLLLADAGITSRDWVSEYRMPYWNHDKMYDWTAAATNFSFAALDLAYHALETNQPKLAAQGALFVPVQWFFEKEVTVCCQAIDICGRAQRCKVSVLDVNGLEQSPPSCCTADSLPLHRDLKVRRLMSAPRSKRDALNQCIPNAADVLRRSISIAEARRIALAEAEFART